MKNCYDILGVKPECSKKKLKKAYMAAISHLEPDDLIGEEQIEQAYRTALANRQHRNVSQKQHGIWQPSKKFRAPYTGPHGSIAARNAIKRFGFKSFFCALGIILLSWGCYFLCILIIPNLFPSSQYSQLAKVFSKELVAALVQLILYIVLTILYVCHVLHRGKNGLRKLKMGSLCGFACLLIGLQVPQSQFVHTVSLINDIKPLSSNHLSSTKNILLEDAFLQTGNRFGDTYTYKVDKTGKTYTVFIPSNLLTSPNGTVHQASVTFLPHTCAAAKVSVRAMKNQMFGCIGDCFYLNVPKDTGVNSIYLKRSSAALFIEHLKANNRESQNIKCNLKSIQLKNPQGTPLVTEITADKVASSLLKDGDLLLCFTAEDDLGNHSCIASVIHQQTGTIINSFKLNGECAYRFFSCAGRYYFFTESAVKESLTAHRYYLQVYDPEQRRIVWTSPQSFTLSSAPHIASFQNNGVWISKHSNGEKPIGEFTVPKEYMN